MEVGLDLQFFKALTINATYYSNETKDLLVNVPLNGSSTYSSLYGKTLQLLKTRFWRVEFDANLLPSSSELK